MAAIPVPASTHPTVAIGAIGTEKAAPDLATIDVRLNTIGPDSDAAMNKNIREFAKIMAVVNKYKIDSKDLRTTGVTVGQEFDYTENEAKLIGFKASNGLSINVRNLDVLGDIIADLAAAGANEMSGPTFSLENNEALTDIAREKAFDTAKRRALAYARKAGFKNVRLLTINEGVNNESYRYAAEAAAEGAVSAAKFDIPAAFIEPGLVTESVFAEFIFEMMP